MPYSAEIEFGHATTVPYEDELIVAGKGWRIGKYFSGVQATTGYCSIVFKTPAGKKTLYKSASIGKTGGEALVYLVEAPTISAGGDVLTPFQLNRNKLDLVCALSDIRSGLDTVVTVTDGVATPPDYLSGETQGSQRSSGNATTSFIYLKPDTYYALKVVNIGATASNINILATFGVDV